MFGTPDLRMIVRLAQRFESDQRIEHRRENCRQAVASFKAFEHPPLRLPESQFTEWPEPVLFDPFMKAVEPKQKIAQRKRSRVARQGQIALVIACRIEFIQGYFGTG